MRRTLLPALLATRQVRQTARAAFAARARDHRDHTTARILSSAGHSSYHTATPPPFRSV